MGNVTRNGSAPADSKTKATAPGRPPGRGTGYLPANKSGLPWMLDPASPELIRRLQDTADGPDTPACWQDYLRDAAELRDLLAKRHMAVVLDPAKRRLTDEVVDRWVSYLRETRPSTRAGCAGTLARDLALALQDGHLYVRHSAGAHSARKAQQGSDPGPAWEAWTSMGVRIIRIRRLDGSDGAEQELLAGAANQAEDFSHAKILVDLRGNGGGDDSYVQSWLAPYARQSVPVCRERGMTLMDGTPLIFWNYLVWLRLTGHGVPDALRQGSAPPAPDDEIRISDSAETPWNGDDGSGHPGAAGTAGWDGRMMVMIDGGTGSSGESAALMLRASFGAVLVGAPSYGIIDYGNAGPYILPASGLEIHLPCQANDWGIAVDFSGIQPDLAVAVDLPAESLAADFDGLFGAAALKRSATTGQP